MQTSSNQETYAHHTSIQSQLTISTAVAIQMKEHEVQHHAQRSMLDETECSIKGRLDGTKDMGTFLRFTLNHS